MSDIIRFTCPYCEKKYKTKPISKPRKLNCQKCGERFKVEISPYDTEQLIVSKLESASSPVLAALDELPETEFQSSLPTKPQSPVVAVAAPPAAQVGQNKVLFVLIGLVLLLAVALFGVVWGLKSTNDKLQATIAAQQENQTPTNDGNPLQPPKTNSSGHVETEVPDPNQSQVQEELLASPDGNPLANPVQADSSSQRNVAAKSEREPELNSNGSGGAAGFQFVENSRYSYRYEFKCEIAASELEINGTNFLKKLPPGELPFDFSRTHFDRPRKKDTSKQYMESSVFAHAYHNDKNSNYLRNSNMELLSNHISKISLKDGQPATERGRMQNEMLPILFLPYQRIGIESLPNGRARWSEKHEVISFSPKVEASGGLHNRSRFRTNLPEHISRLLYRPQPATNQRNLLITSLAIDTSYEVESEDDKEMKVKKTYVISTENEDETAVTHSLEADGHYVFDKTSGCIKSSYLEGQAEIESNNIIMKIPFEFSVELRDVKSEQQVKDQVAEARKRVQESMEKRRKEREARRTESAGDNESNPQVFSSKTNESEETGRVPNHVVAIFEDMGWGVNSLAFSTDEILYAGKMDRKILVFDYKSRRKIDEVSDLEQLGQVQKIRVTPDGKKLLAGGYSGRIEIYELRKDGSLQGSNYFAGHSEEISSLAISSDSKIVASGDREKVRIWDLEKRKEMAVFDGFERPVYATFISDDQSFVLASDGSSLLRADKSDAGEFELKRQANLERNYAHAAAFTPDGKYLAVSYGYDVSIFNTDTFQNEFVLKGPHNIHYALEFDPTGQYLFAGGKFVSQWDWQNGKKINEYHLTDYATVKSVAITGDGKHLASIGSSAGQNLKVFKVRSEQED